MISFIKKIFVMLLLMLPLLSGAALVASASSGNADINQIMDDSIQSYYPQYDTLQGGAQVVSFSSPNTITCGGYNSTAGSQCSSSVNTTTQNFVWTQRFQWYFKNSTTQMTWEWANIGGTADDIQCTSTGICTLYARTGSNLLAATSSIPSSCYQVGSSTTFNTWCWARITRSGDGTSLKFEVATDNGSGQPNAFTTYINSTGGVISNTIGGTFYWGVVSYGGLFNLGGGPYSCINHISANINYDCLGTEDTSTVFYDTFWNNSAYGGGSSSYSNNVLNVTSGTNVTFQPFGNVSGSSVPNFTWITRINNQTTNGNNRSLVTLFGSNSNFVASGTALGIDFTYSTPILTSNTSGSESNAIATFPFNSQLSAPYYVKMVYVSPNLSVYTAPASTDGTSYPTNKLNWTLDLSNVNISSYLYGSYFGWLNGTGLSLGIGGGINVSPQNGSSITYPCLNVVSKNTSYDCFSSGVAGTYFKKNKLVGVPSTTATPSPAFPDTNQLFDDNINLGPTSGVTIGQYAVNGPIGSSPSVTYVSPNIVQCGLYSSTYGSQCVVGNISTQNTFVWTGRFRGALHSGSGGGTESADLTWGWDDNGSSADTFQCNPQGTCMGINFSGTTVVTAGSAIPSSCYSVGTGSMPSSWCWFKIVRNGTTATLSIATDTSGVPGTFTQYATSNSFGANNGDYIIFGIEDYNPNNSGSMQIGGNYSCVNHISTNINYNCFANADTSLQWNDNFWSGSPNPYTFATGTSETNYGVLTLNASTTGQTWGWFAPFGASETATALQAQNFTWITRINSESAIGQVMELLYGSNTNTTSPLTSLSDLELCYSSTKGYCGATGVTSALLSRTNGTASVLASTLLQPPTAPYYIKSVYNGSTGKITIYYGPANSTTNIVSNWTTWFSAVTVNSALQGPYFGYLARNITAANSLVIDGSTSNYCPNYVSTSLTYDCF